MEKNIVLSNEQNYEIDGPGENRKLAKGTRL